MKKYIKMTVISIFCVIFIIVTTFIMQLLGNNVIRLKKITEEDKKVIIDLMNLSNLGDYIEIEKIETPKTYKDKYYKIYFEIDKNQATIDNKSRTSSNIYIDFKRIKTKSDTVKYSCTVSAFGNIEVLENIMEKYN